MKRLVSLVCALTLLGCCLAPALAIDQPARGYVALTFDDGPCRGVTEEILAILDASDVRASFFVCGCCLDAYPEAMEAYLAGGHEVGSHSYSHTYLQKLPLEEVQAELDRALEGLAQAGVTTGLFRAPGGLCSDALRQTCRELDLSIIAWSVDPRDWEPGLSEATVARRVLESVQDGDIILLHELHPATVEALPLILQGLEERGLTPVTVSELAQRKGICLEPGREYHRFS